MIYGTQTSISKDLKKTNMGKYHYEWFVYTDNLCYGRMFLGKDLSKTEAYRIGKNANRGVFVLEKKRVYN